MAVRAGSSTDKTGYLPRFGAVDDERRWRKLRLAGAYRMFARFGLDEGAAGHITVRDPEDPDSFWVGRLGQNFASVTPADLIRVDRAGHTVGGEGDVNQAAFAIHSAIHEERPDVMAAAHSHSTYGKAWSAFGRPLDPYTQDACMFYDDHSVFDVYEGVVYSPDSGDQIAKTLGDGKALILVNHGLLTVGHSVEEAAYWFVTMERSCQVQLQIEQCGIRPRRIDDETAALTCSQVGTHWVGWLAFSTLWQEFVTTELDLAAEESELLTRVVG